MLSTVEIQPYCLVKQMINTFLTFDFYRLLINLSPFSTGPFRCTFSLVPRSHSSGGGSGLGTRLVYFVFQVIKTSLASNPQQFHLTFVYIT